MNLFYQVFDKGKLTDGEGRDVDFKNTLMILTSNLASDVVMSLFEGDARPSAAEVELAIRPILSRHFKPALLARMTIVPFAPLPRDIIRDIADMRLRQLGRRLEEAHRITPAFAPDVLDAIAAKCTEAETGARNVEHVIRGTLMPLLSRAILERLSTGQRPSGVAVGVDAAGGFTVEMTV
jgi:type VI secretion system protein VasG